MIVITNGNEKCGVGHAQWRNDRVKALVNVLKEGQNAEIDLEATLKMQDDLKNLKSVGTFQVRKLFFCNDFLIFIINTTQLAKKQKK